MAIELVPATTLGDDELAALLSAVYAGYWHPVEGDAAALRRMVTLHDLDLDESVVAFDATTPVALGMLGIRDHTGWVGGMGVLREWRRQGLGRLVTTALLANAARRGASRVRLEVLEQNAPAIALYGAVGFERFRDVAVWRLDDAPDGRAAFDADVDDVLAELAIDVPDAPWQRSAATIARLRETGSELLAVRTAGGAAVFSPAPAGATIHELSASTADAAAALLRAPFDRGSGSAIWLNGPVDGACARALRESGATSLARQHEMEWRPSPRG